MYKKYSQKYLWLCASLSTNSVLPSNSATAQRVHPPLNFVLNSPFAAIAGARLPLAKHQGVSRDQNLKQVHWPHNASCHVAVHPTFSGILLWRYRGNYVVHLSKENSNSSSIPGQGHRSWSKHWNFEKPSFARQRRILTMFDFLGFNSAVM